MPPSRPPGPAGKSSVWRAALAADGSNAAAHVHTSAVSSSVPKALERKPDMERMAHIHDPHNSISEAPLQFKSNCGVFLIDKAYEHPGAGAIQAEGVVGELGADEAGFVLDALRFGGVVVQNIKR